MKIVRRLRSVGIISIADHHPLTTVDMSVKCDFQFHNGVTPSPLTHLPDSNSRVIYVQTRRRNVDRKTLLSWLSGDGQKDSRGRVKTRFGYNTVTNAVNVLGNTLEKLGDRGHRYPK